MPISLRDRITLTGVVVVALVLVGLDLVVYASISRELRQSTEAVLRERMDVAAALAGELPVEDLAAQLQAAGIVATVTMADGTVLRGAPPSPAIGAGLPASADEPSSRLVGTVALPDGSRAEVVVSRVGVVRVLDHARTVMVLATVSGVAVAAVLCRRGATLALRPLEVVVDAARRVTAGEDGVRVGPPRTDTEVGVVGAAFDGVVDALESALDDARRQAEANERFLADAAHQIRTPITAIQAATESLSMNLDGAGRQQATALIVGQTERAAALLARLLRLTKLDMGEVPQQEVVDLETLCRIEVQRAEQLSPSLQIAFSGDMGGAVPIELDPASMSEALANVLDNARRHARSRVDVSLAVEGADIVVRVRDDGDGVPATAVDDIFERFVSLDGRGGSGLGLPIARAIVEAHGGSLRYERGAFSMRLARERRHRPRAVREPMR